jgi:hypothetical protein
VSATPAQCKYIDDIFAAGCPIPEHAQFDRPDDSMYLSVEAADTFIKANKHWCSHKPSLIIEHSEILKEMSDRIRMDEWGGIPNC